jgi:hypothetical protein
MNGNELQMEDCNGQICQHFTQGFNGVPFYTDGTLDGTLRILDKCLDIVGNGTANGTQVQIYDCNGGANQVRALQLDGSIKNPQSGRCCRSPDPTVQWSRGSEVGFLPRRGHAVA